MACADQSPGYDQPMRMEEKRPVYADKQCDVRTLEPVQLADGEMPPDHQVAYTHRPLQRLRDLPVVFDGDLRQTTLRG